MEVFIQVSNQTDKKVTEVINYVGNIGNCLEKKTKFEYKQNVILKSNSRYEIVLFLIKNVYMYSIFACPSQ